MVCILEVFLCKLRFTRGFVHHFLRRWALLLAFLGRRFGVWQPRNDGKRGVVTFRKTDRAGRSFRSTTQFDSREWVAAASYVPASASAGPRLHHVPNGTRQPQPATSPGASYSESAAHLTAEPHHRDCAHPTSSDRTRSHGVGQPSQFLQAAEGYLGHGLFASPSSERLSRSPSRRDHSPLLPSSRAHVPSSPPSNPGHCRSQSPTSVDVGVNGPSTESLHLNPLTSPPPLTDEPFAICSSTAHPCLVSDALHLCDRPPQLSTGTSFTLSNASLPVKPMNPDQVPRYTRNITVQVDGFNGHYQMLTTSLVRPRERPDYEIPPFTTTFRPEQGSHENCAPWVSATHPDGALYFFDPDRVRALAPI